LLLVEKLVGKSSKRVRPNFATDISDIPGAQPKSSIKDPRSSSPGSSISPNPYLPQPIPLE